MPPLFRAFSWLLPIATCFGVGLSLPFWLRVEWVESLWSIGRAEATAQQAIGPSPAASRAEGQPVLQTTQPNHPQLVADPSCSMEAAPTVASVSSASTLAKNLPQLGQWLSQSEPVLNSLLSTVESTVIAYQWSQPHPGIQARSRLARVPVIMYHDILPEKQVYFDVTPEELEEHFKLIRDNGLTPVSLDQLVTHLATGMPLPAKPVLLTFDDGYEGHYTHVLPLLHKYNYPAAFGIYTAKVGTRMGRSSLTWEQVQAMAADPLVTIAAHSVTHPRDLSKLPESQLRQEVVESKRILEERLGIPIRHFVYPEGNYDERVQYWVQRAGFHSALTMRKGKNNGRFANESENLFSIERFEQSQLQEAIAQSYGGPPLPRWGSSLDFNTPIQPPQPIALDNTNLLLISGGRPVTLHGDRRYSVPDLIANTNAVAAVDGAFFSLETLTSNVIIGPVLAQNTGRFVPGNASENRKLRGRPLVLISPTQVRFIPFDPDRHNTLAGIRAEMPVVTDAFVGAKWLVRDNQPQPPSHFSDLYGADMTRHRAFWGIDQMGRPVIGVSKDPIDSAALAQLLSKVGLRDVVMVDSGRSTALAYREKLLVEGYEPRPVPHVVALVPPGVQANFRCRGW